MEDIQRKLLSILMDCLSLPIHCLPYCPGRPFRSLQTRASRLRNSFLPTIVSLLFITHCHFWLYIHPLTPLYVSIVLNFVKYVDFTSICYLAV